MKKLLLITTPLLLVACSHDTPPASIPSQPSLADLPAETARQGRYIALPGQAAVDTDAAFDQHAAAYNTPAPAPVTDPAAPMAPVQPVAQPVMQQTTFPTAAGTAVVMTPAPVQQPTSVYGTTPMGGYNNLNGMAVGSAAIGGTAMGVLPGADAAMTGPIDYTLRVTNATRGRVFVEAQDAAGEIYPCGFMTASQSISSEKKQVNPIKGPITIVVRDPDKPDAPELRRYKVDPPTGYAGKTVEITIISGGLYQVSVDGQVRYITPTPVGKPDLGNAASTSPAEAAAAEAAKAAEEAAANPGAPAPEQTPAGM